MVLAAQPVEVAGEGRLQLGDTPLDQALRKVGQGQIYVNHPLHLIRKLVVSFPLFLGLAQLALQLAGPQFQPVSLFLQPALLLGNGTQFLVVLVQRQHQRAQHVVGRHPLQPLGCFPLLLVQALQSLRQLSQLLGNGAPALLDPAQQLALLGRGDLVTQLGVAYLCGGLQHTLQSGRKAFPHGPLKIGQHLSAGALPEFGF